MSRPEKAYAWRKKQGADAHNKIHKKKTTKNMTDNQQANLKEPSHLLHYTTQRTHARLFLERGAACLPSFPQPSGEYKSEFEFAQESPETQPPFHRLRGVERPRPRQATVAAADPLHAPKFHFSCKKNTTSYLWGDFQVLGARNKNYMGHFRSTTGIFLIPKNTTQPSGEY